MNYHKRSSKRRYSELSLLGGQEDPDFLEVPDFREDIWFPIRQMTRTNFNTTSFLESEITSKSSFIIQPESKTKLLWDIFMSLLIAVQLMILPIVLFLNDSDEKDLQFADFLLNEFFLFDILFKLNTALYESGHMINTRWSIARRYLKTWFFYDFITIIPFDQIYSNIAVYDSYEDLKDHHFDVYRRLVAYIKIIRLIRMLRWSETTKLIEDYFPNPQIIRILRFTRMIIWAVYINHYVACIWFYISYLDVDGNSDSWVAKRFALGEIDTSTLYIKAFYFALTTTASVGYGDFKAITSEEILFDIFTMGIAVVIFSWIVGEVSDWVVAQTLNDIQFSNKMINLNRYMKKKNLPKDLRFKLRTYMHFYLDLKANNKSDEAKVLDWLSIPLREEMLGITRGKVFENCQTFKKLYKSKILNEISKLIKIQRFAPDDIVFEEEEKSYTIYFIIGGIVEVYHKNTTTVFKELSDNACFGEIGFFAMHPRTASVRSVTYSDMMSIERGDLEELLKTKPEANLRTKYLFNYCQRDVDSKYAILGIKCYLCGTLGHTSNSCYKVVVKADLNELKNKWVNDRQFGKKLRNVTFQSLKNMRKTKNLKIRADPKRVLGIPRPVEDAWKNKKTLIDKINLFIDEEDEDEIFEPSKTLQNTFKNYENVIGHLTSESSEDLESLRAIFKPRMSPDLMVRPENIIKSRSIRERDEWHKMRSYNNNQWNMISERSTFEVSDHFKI